MMAFNTGFGASLGAVVAAVALIALSIDDVSAQRGRPRPPPPPPKQPQYIPETGKKPGGAKEAAGIAAAAAAGGFSEKDLEAMFGRKDPLLDPKARKILESLIEEGLSQPAREKPQVFVPETLREPNEERRILLDKVVGPEWSSAVESTTLPLPTLVQLASAADGSAQHKLRFSITDQNATTAHEMKVPKWEFFGVERKVIARRFFENLGPVRANDPILFFTSDLDFSTNTFLPGHLSARTFDSSPRFISEHVDNIGRLASRPLRPSQTAFFNLIPESEPANPRESARWARIRGEYQEFASEKGLSPRLSNRAEILKELQEGSSDTIVIVGHGDRDSIHLPDGSRITVSDVLELPRTVREPIPVVVLVACETGRAARAGVNTIAQALLMRGRATAVVAPTRKIPAAGASLAFLRGLFSRDKVPASAALKDLGPPWQLYVEFTLPVMIARTD